MDYMAIALLDNAVPTHTLTYFFLVKIAKARALAHHFEVTFAAHDFHVVMLLLLHRLALDLLLPTLCQGECDGLALDWQNLGWACEWLSMSLASMACVLCCFLVLFRLRGSWEEDLTCFPFCFGAMV